MALTLQCLVFHLKVMHKQTYSWKLEAWVSMRDLSVDTRHLMSNNLIQLIYKFENNMRFDSDTKTLWIKFDSWNLWFLSPALYCCQNQ